jgi:Uma2 family endonuclease
MSTLTAPSKPVPAPTIPGSAPTIPPPAAAPRFYRLSVEQYHEIARHGILKPSDRVELLEGLLIQKMTIHPPHRWAVRKLGKTLGRYLPAGWFEDIQQPITLDDSEPEPDGSVIRGEPEQYAGRHPNALELGLVAEVSDSSLDEDRGWKKQIYARARIPVYWIVNLVDSLVEVYTDPTGPADQPDYRQRRDYGPTEEVPLVLDGKEIARIPVSALLP